MKEFLPEWGESLIWDVLCNFPRDQSERFIFYIYHLRYIVDTKCRQFTCDPRRGSERNPVFFPALAKFLLKKKPLFR